jgi:hypothetical protein
MLRPPFDFAFHGPPPSAIACRPQLSMAGYGAWAKQMKTSKELAGRRIAPTLKKDEQPVAKPAEGGGEDAPFRHPREQASRRHAAGTRGGLARERARRSPGTGPVNPPDA